MKVIKIEFERLYDVTLDRLPRAIGVYVLWSGKSWVKPAYIGEGEILKRFADHSRKIPSPLEGVISIFGYGSKRSIKMGAEIVEAILLLIAEDVDRLPTLNRSVGKRSRIHKIFRKHGRLKIYISGYDPLLDPRSPRMKNKKIIELHKNYYGQIVLNHPWKLRPLARL